jgi:hypothetical protein
VRLADQPVSREAGLPVKAGGRKKAQIFSVFHCHALFL